MTDELQAQEEMQEQQQEQQEQQQKPVDLKDVLKDKEVQAEIDRRITKALATAKEKWDKEAEMTDEQRNESRLSQREQELEERIRDIDLRERTGNVTDALRGNGLPIALAPLIASTSDDESYKAVVADIKREWDTQLAESLKASARQEAPKASYKGTATTDKDGLGDFAQKIRKVK